MIEGLLLALVGAFPSPVPAASTAAPTDDYDKAVAEAEATFEAWGKSAKYAAHSAVDGRVLVWTSKAGKASKLKKTAERACKFFDKIAALPDAEVMKEFRPPVARTAVLFEVDDVKDLGALQEYIGSKVPYLQAWATSGDPGVGFVLEDPLASAWLGKVEKSKEWNAENELVHRLTQLLLLQRFGRMPQWLAQGLAWYVEFGVCQDIYCFPFRSGFVGRAEHKGWYAELSALMASRAERPLQMPELAEWSRGTYGEKHAGLAWAAGILLAKYYAAELPGVLAEFAHVRHVEGRTTHSDGSWETIPDYEVPTAKQLEILSRRLGVDFEAALDRFCRHPRAYVRPR